MKIRKLVRWLLGAIALLGAGLWIGLLGWNRSGHLERFVLDEIRARLPEGYQLRRCDLEVVPSGTIEIRDLELIAPDAKGPLTILTVERCRLEVDWTGAVTGALPIASVDLVQPTIHLQIDADGGTNFDRLIEAFESSEPSNELPELPEITLRHGVVTVTIGDPDDPDISACTLDDVTALCRPAGAHRARISAWVALLGGDLRATGELEFVRDEKGEPELRTREPLQARARGLDLAESLLVEGAWPELLAGHSLRGRVDAQAELHLGAGGVPGRLGPVRQAELRLSGVQALPSVFPYPVTDLELVARFDWREGLMLDRLDGTIGTGQVRGQGAWLQLADPDSLALLLTLEDLQLDALLKRAVTEALGPDIWPIANPSGGRVDIELQIPVDPRPTDLAANLSAQARAVVRGGRMAYRGVYTESMGREAGFPYPAEDLDGEVKIVKVGPGFDNVRVLFQDIEAKAGTGIAHAFGSLVVTPESDVLNLTIEATELTIDETLRATVEQAFGLTELWDRLSPSGEGGGGYRSVQDPGRDSVEFATIELTNGSATYSAVPYPLTHLSGRVDILGSVVVWRDIRGRNGSNRVIIDGDLVSNDEGEDLRLWIRGEDIAFDWTLRDALIFERPLIADYWGDFNPRDREALTADIDFRGHQPAGTDDFFFDCGAKLKGGELLYDVFPTTLRLEGGQIEVNLQPAGLRIEVNDLRGRPAQGLVTANGTLIQPEGTEVPLVDLTIEADEVVLDYELLNAVRGLNESGAAFLDLIHAPRGLLDATVTLRGPANPEQLQPNAEFWLKRGSFSLGPNQRRLEQFEGHFEIDGEKLIGWDLQADVAGGIVRCPEIRLTFEEPGNLTGRLRGEGLPFDENLLETLPPKLRQALDFVDTDSGDFDFELRNFHAQISAEGATEATFGATLDLRRWNGSIGFPVDNWSGRLLLTRARDAQGRFVTQGELRDAQIDVLGERLSELRARFQFDDRRLKVQTLEGSLYSGRLEAIPDTISYDFNGGYRGRIVAAGTSLRQLVGDRIAAERNIFGTLQGQLDFDSTDGTLDGLTGQGTVEIFEGKIWDFPVLAEMSRLLGGLIPVVPPAFRTGQLAFAIRDRELSIERLAFQSPVLDVSGQGSLRFDGVLDVRLRPAAQSPIRLPIIMQLFQLLGGILGGSVGSFRIHGMISAPTTTYSSLVDNVTSIVRTEQRPRKVPFASPARERRRTPRF